MEEWSDWVVDNDPSEMIRQMRSVLADRKRSHHDKLEALTLLTNLADDASVEVLQWYKEHADPGMEVTSMLALMEARRLNRPPSFEPWHDRVLEKIHQVGAELSIGGHLPTRDQFCQALAEVAREEGWQVNQGGHAILKYDGQMIDLTAIDLVVNNQLLIGFWDREDEEAAWLEMEEEFPEDEEVFDPLEHFYASLRTANLSWGILIDISGDTIFTDMVENMEIDRGAPRVEYILALP